MILKVDAGKVRIATSFHASIIRYANHGSARTEIKFTHGIDEVFNPAFINIYISNVKNKRCQELTFASRVQRRHLPSIQK